MTTPADAAPRRRRSVERIEDWDHARYAVTPPRAALDARLTLIHFRLMSMLGRVNTRQGWCEMSQTTFAAQLGYARGSVVRAVGELVAWAYIEMRGQAETGSARCHYRLLIDEPEVPAEIADDDAETCHAAGDTSLENTCHVAGDTGVTSHESDVSRSKHTLLDQRSEITPPHPPAAAGGREGEDSRFEAGQGRRRRRPSADDAIEAALAEVAAADPGRRRVIDRLLAPLLRQRRWDAPTVTGSLIALADWPYARAQPDAVLNAAARHLLETRKATVKPADVQAALKAPHVLAAMNVWVLRGTPAWDAWVAHMRADPRQRTLVRHVEEASRWPFPTEYPPPPEATP